MTYTDADHHLPLSVPLDLALLAELLRDPWAASDHLKDRGATLTDLLVLYARDMSAPRPFRMVEAEFYPTIFIIFGGQETPLGPRWVDDIHSTRQRDKKALLAGFGDEYGLWIERKVVSPAERYSEDLGYTRQFLSPFQFVAPTIDTQAFLALTGTTYQ